jgi:hypothetical protein
VSTEPSRPSESDAGARRPVPVGGPVLTAGLLAGAGAMLAAATLGWLGVGILVAFLAAGCTVLVRWSR